MSLPHQSLPDQQVRRNFESIDAKFPLSTQDIQDGAVTDAKLASPNNSVYRTIFGPVGMTHQGLAGLSTTRLCYTTAGAFAQSGANTQNGLALFYLDDAEYAVAGKTTELRVRGIAMTNTTDPGIDVTFGLYEITAAGGGTANNIQYTIAASPVASSTAVITNADLNGSDRETAVSSGFAVPSDGYYALGAVGSGAQAANSALSLSVYLQLRNT